MPMMHLHDTMSRELRPVVPMDGHTLRFYCCGPTVYGPAHIGNFRTFTAQDTFRRVMELAGGRTKHVRNLTDVDDKTIRRSQEEGRSLQEFTDFWRDKFHADCRALNLLAPHVEPSAVEHIPQQIAMILTLLERGHAYQAADGSVYFKIGSFREYGRLSHLDMRELQLGAAVAADEYEKEGVADFALWKARKPEDGPNFWSSPWGDGRPGWHLECSAMTREYLGDTFDLHSGGVDLIFPHHENEIAQSECCTGEQFSRLWFHVNHLLVEGQKMSKKLGNLFTLDDLRGMGHTAARIRFLLLSGHYRTPLNFTLANLEGARQPLAKIARAERHLAQRAGSPPTPDYEDLRGLRAAETGAFWPAFEALLDDLNTPEAFGRIFTAISRIKPDQLTPEEALTHWRGLHFALAALGLDVSGEGREDQSEAPAEVMELAQDRWRAKQAKDWAQADTLRAQIEARGWLVKDAKDGFALLPKTQSLPGA
jgi:cysteinyl-tRNA synthetase